VLKNSADAEVETFAGRGDADRSSVHANAARVGPLQARKDADQGRLSRAILAEQDMNLTGKDVECDIVVRDNSGKPLGDAAARRLTVLTLVHSWPPYVTPDGFGIAALRCYFLASTDVIRARTFCAS
jgi:hypothetical protein